MSLEAAIARVAQIQGMLAPAAAPAPATTPTPEPAATGTPAGQAIVNLARAEVGVTEQPPGSNDSPRIAQFRQATAGAPGPGPWCAYFVSWAAREAGVPIGDAGQGYGRVDDVWAWAERSGKAIPTGSGRPQPGDLIVWDEHIGIVESVGADGSIHTIEGNSSDRVAQRTYGSDGGGAIGYVRLG
jgi:CHAP domain